MAYKQTKTRYSWERSWPVNLYFKLLGMPVFRIEDVNRYYDNMDSARSAVKRLMGRGMAVKIRNNLYTCISGETGQPVANRFQIASSITPTSYISHHTAMEYYGITDQVYYEVCVSSETRFSDFEFDGYLYRYMPSKNPEGIERPAYSGGIAVTNLERTLVDSVKDMDKIAGMEEVICDIECMHQVRENRLLRYLELYHNQFLYQKMGFLLSANKENLRLSEDFFEVCKQQIGKSKRYLTKEAETGRYDKEWKLIVPEGLFDIKNGVNEYVDV